MIMIRMRTTCFDIVTAAAATALRCIIPTSNNNSIEKTAKTHDIHAQNASICEFHKRT